MWAAPRGWFAGKGKGRATDQDESSNQESASSSASELDGAKEPLHYTQSKAHHAKNGTFVNPWPSAKPKPSTNWIPTFQVPVAWAQELHPSIKRVKTVKPDFDKTCASNEIKVTWLGHAGVLAQLPRLTASSRSISIVVDPIFSARSSPSQYAGPARRLPIPCSVDELPHIDFVFISHNHYDHLDFDTVQALIKRGDSQTRFVVPLGLKSWFTACRVPEEQLVELDWWDDATFLPADINESFDGLNELGSVRISCVPAQHNSARTGLDRATTLWAGFVIEQFTHGASLAPERTCVYFAGDTGYRAAPGGETCPAFEQIGERFGPIDFSAIPIWRGGTLSFVASFGVRLHHEALTMATHATPDDAVCIHSDVRSNSTLAIHFATFAGSEDEATYPISLLEEACIDVYIPMDLRAENGFGVCDVGETVLVPVRRKVD